MITGGEPPSKQDDRIEKRPVIRGLHGGEILEVETILPESGSPSSTFFEEVDGLLLRRW